MDKNCWNCVTNTNSVFRVLSEDERQILKQDYKCKFVKRGEIIFKEGEKPKGLICLSSGKVKVFKEGMGGRDQIVRLARPVGFIGYRALFAEENHTATAVALEDSTICIFLKESLYAVLQKNSILAMQIIKAFASELGFTINRTVTLTQKHIRGRLAESLLFLIDTYGMDSDGKTLKVCLSREEIANLSSMTTSNAIRTLSKFSQEGVIELSGKKIKVVDYQKLEQISNLG
ncbi:MAG: Crp/Fnr family transcriptional regulator [Bacteroidales bacterium]|nr:Crp/Fnr family transcriptional regulator [Bacteroidales bacterium]